MGFHRVQFNVAGREYQLRNKVHVGIIFDTSLLIEAERGYLDIDTLVAIALGFSVGTFDKKDFERIEGLKIEILH